MTSFTEARQEIYRLIRDHYPGEVSWENMPFDIDSPRETWARISVAHSLSEQRSLADSKGSVLWVRRGNVFVQVFVELGTGMKRIDELTKSVVDAMESHRGKVMFRNCRVNEVGLDGAWYQMNVIAGFEYEDLK